MTVPSTDNRRRYFGNGSTTEFEYPKGIFEDTDLTVYLVDDSTGDPDLQTLNSDYTVTNAGSANGGDVVFTTAPASGKTVIILREVDVTQNTKLRNQRAFTPVAIEKEFDRRAMVDLQLRDAINRSLKLDKADLGAEDDMTLPAKSERAGKLSSFDDDGKPSVTTQQRTTGAVFSSVSSLRAENPANNKDGDLAVLFAEDSDDITGNLRWDSDSTTDDNGYKVFKPDSINSADPGRWVLVSGTYYADITANIPSHYATLQAAIEDLSRFRVKQGVVIDLMIESGHQPESGVSIVDSDCRNFRISSIDSEVTVGSGYTGDFINAQNSIAPVLNCLIDANHLGGKGCVLAENSSFTARSGSGVKNAADRALYGNQCARITASDTVWTGANGRGLWLTRASHAFVSRADFSNCGDGSFNIWISRNSYAMGMAIKANNSKGTAAHCHRSGSLVAHEGEFNDASNDGVKTRRGGQIIINDADVLRAGGVGIEADNGEVYAVNATVTGASGSSDNGLQIRGYGKISIAGGSVSDFGSQQCAVSTGELIANGASITDGPGNGVTVEDGGRAMVAGATITGNSSNDLAVQTGSQIFANGCATTNGASSPDLSDTNVTGFNFSDNGNQGFIWT